jgi:hypothetical protein
MAKYERRDKSRETYWQQKLHAQSQSGLSIRAFCRQEKLAETAFYFWRREIARRRASGGRKAHGKTRSSSRCR